ncbi:NAD(P)H-dependent oxidoreductase [Pseudomonas viridiflava]|uniref:NAD(P)H-dependent oxidoreductase n=1 Tax=Pseudomonas viridiflava TaxID=33069 RepID=UPI000F02A47F|nr:NAD(P)H-dependent oxidoreductase [Pseudomonas viridiflava]
MSEDSIDETQKKNTTQWGRRDLVKAGLTVTAAVLAPGVANATSPSAAPTTAKKVLIINAHQTYPGMSEGRLTRTLIDVIQARMESKGFQVRHTYIEKGYEVNDEVQKHVWADIIITQSPLFWFGSPWIYKKYIDEVFTAGLIQKSMVIDDGRTRKDPTRQYGSGGNMHGKQYLLSLTMNAPSEAFGNRNQELFSGRTVGDLMLSNTANYAFSGVKILPLFVCADVIKTPKVDQHINELKQHLTDVFG